MLRQRDILVLEHEKRFHDLSLFASQFVSTEQYMMDKLQDGLCQELR
jgi:hypothetical protein